jgi:membrane associated rhomboid family serine protease
MSLTSTTGRRAGTTVASWGSATIPVLALVAVMWVVEAADAVLPGSFDVWGIRPRSGDGLVGIVLAPILHVGFAHLIANTVAFLVLGCAIAITTHRFWRVTIGVALLSGLGVWLFAAPGTVTVGASGLVYGYATFLVAWGLFTARTGAIVVAVLVGLVYGGLVFGVLPGRPGISWQGHLFGAIAGVVMAWWLSRRRGRPASSRRAISLR